MRDMASYGFPTYTPRGPRVLPTSQACASCSGLGFTLPEGMNKYVVAGSGIALGLLAIYIYTRLD